MCEAPHVCPSLAQLERVLNSASASLQDARSEMAALQAENERLRRCWGPGKLQLQVSRKPVAFETCRDTLVLDDGDTDSRHERSLSHGSSAPASHVGEFEDDPITYPEDHSCVEDNVPQGEILVKHERTMGSQLSMEYLQETMASTEKVRKRSEWAVRLWLFLDDPESSFPAYVWSKLLDPVLQFSVILSVLQTTEPAPLDSSTFDTIQMSVDLFFLVELIARLCVCPSIYYFVRNFYNITDAVAGALPLSLRFSELLFGAYMDAGAGKFLMFGVAPVLRELKMLRRVQQFFLFIRLLEDVKEAVQLLMMLLAIVVLVFSSLLWAVEPTQNIGSMPRAMYLTIVTVTTVGYGDITPQSTAGVCVTSILTLFSILYTAMPIGIIGNAFTQIWQDRDRILLMIKTRAILLQSGFTAKDLPSIFRAYDSSGEGQLYFHEFFTMVQEMKLGLNEQRAIEVFESVDRDGGGTIDEQEFVRLVFPSAYHELYKKSTNGEDAVTSENHGSFSRKVSSDSKRSEQSVCHATERERKETMRKKRKSLRSGGSASGSE